MRDADSWTKIDYTAQAKTWMEPLRKGNETGLVCIPANWYVINNVADVNGGPPIV